MSTVFSADNNFTQYKKPWLTIEFTAQRMGLDIRLNDIPVFNIDNTGFMTLEVPANEYLINGNNEVKVTTHPLFGDDDEQMDNYIEGTSTEIGIYIREEDDPIKNRKLISKVIIRPNNAYLKSPTEGVATFMGNASSKNQLSLKVSKNEELLNYPGYGNYNKQIVTSWIIPNVKTLFPDWSWQSGQQISNNNLTYESLLLAYTELYNAFSKKDLNNVKEISNQRSYELAVAYYLEDSNAGFEYSALGKNIDHPTIKLFDDIFLNNTKLEILGDGKLARIMNGAHTHPILFLDYDIEQTYKPQFMWYRKNNKWILIR